MRQCKLRIRRIEHARTSPGQGMYASSGVVWRFSAYLSPDWKAPGILCGAAALASLDPGPETPKVAK